MVSEGHAKAEPFSNVPSGHANGAGPQLTEQCPEKSELIKIVPVATCERSLFLELALQPICALAFLTLQ